MKSSTHSKRVPLLGRNPPVEKRCRRPTVTAFPSCYSVAPPHRPSFPLFFEQTAPLFARLLTHILMWMSKARIFFASISPPLHPPALQVYLSEHRKQNLPQREARPTRRRRRLAIRGRPLKGDASRRPHWGWIERKACIHSRQDNIVSRTFNCTEDEEHGPEYREDNSAVAESTAICIIHATLHK